MYGLERSPPHGDRISTVGQSAVPDQGEGAGGPKKMFLRPPLPPPPLSGGLDPPLVSALLSSAP